ncbi:MAG: hypothetical protein WC389_12380 [Lutibacter sp.]|jgi:hypothetical protein
MLTPQERAAMNAAQNFQGNSQGIQAVDVLGIKGFNGSDDSLSGKEFSVTIANAGTSATDVLVAVFAGPYESVNAIRDNVGSTPAAIVVNGNFITTTNAVVSASSTDCSIDAVQGLLKRNRAMVLKSIKIEADNADALSKALEYHEVDINGATRREVRKMSSGKSSQSTDDKRAELVYTGMAEPLILSGESVILATIKAGRTVTLTFVVDMSISQSAALSAIYVKNKRR